MQRDLLKKPKNKPTKKTQKKTQTKETHKRAPYEKCTKNFCNVLRMMSYTKNPTKNPAKKTYKRDLQKSPTQKMCVLCNARYSREMHVFMYI